MYIKEVEIKNWRSINGESGISVEFGEQMVILAGSNDSGKTSVLLATYAALLVLHKQKDSWLNQIVHKTGNRHIDNTGRPSENEPVVTLTLELEEDDVDEIVSGFKSPIKDKLRNFLLNLNKWRVHVYIERMVDDGSNIKIENDGYSLESLGDVFEMAMISSGEDRGYVYGFNMQVLPEIEKKISEIKPLFIPNSREYNPYRYQSTDFQEEEVRNPRIGTDASELLRFIELINSETGRINGKYDQLIKYMQYLFPDIISIETNRPVGGQPPKDIFIKRSDSRYQPLSRSGSGVASALYLVGKLLLADDKNNTILFIDEPELGLHPRLQTRFMKLLRELSKEFAVQWVISTHSPYILRKLGDRDRLYLVHHNGSNSECKKINVKDKELLFDALGAHLPEAFAAKGVIYVEGATEFHVIRILLEKIGFDIEKENLLIIPLGGENLYSINPNDLKKLHDKAMVIIDSDLSREVSNGGNVTKKKKELKFLCEQNDITFFMDERYRTIENMYHSEILSDILDKNVEVKPYDKVNEITDRLKVEIGKKVATKMSIQEAENFPYIQAIRSWWDYNIGTDNKR